MDEQVIAAPLNELAVRNAKNAGECEELHLGGRSISHLADKNSMKNDFEMFANLEVLWVNDNRLSRLDGISANFRIKVLYAHNNRISSLKDSSIEEMTFLDTLTLYNNKLSDFKGILDILQRRRHLHHLDLYGNPIAEEKDYRLHVIKMLPWLEVLDRHRITEAERAAATKLKPLDTEIDLMGGGSKGKGGGNEKGARRGDAGGFWGSSVLDESADPSGLASAHGLDALSEGEQRRMLQAVLTRMRTFVRKKRICLKPHFVELDPRGEEALTEDVVVETLDLYGLWPDRDVGNTNSTASLLTTMAGGGDDDELGGGGQAAAGGTNLLATQMSRTSLNSSQMGAFVPLKSKFTGAIARTKNQELLLRRWECEPPVRTTERPSSAS